MNKYRIKTVCTIVFTIANVMGQLPDFTPIDTGGIYNKGQSIVHASGIVADIDMDGDIDPVICNIGTPTVFKPPLWLYKNEGRGRYADNHYH